MNDCQINLFVINDLGEITLTESIDFCIIAEQSKQKINSNSDLEIYNWDLTKDDGCLVDFGKYTIVLEVNNILQLSFSRICQMIQLNAMTKPSI